jgi:hypothetical protein
MKNAMKLALEALKFEDSGDPECEHGFMYDECSNDKCDKRQFHEAIKALEEALAQQEPDDLMIAYMSGLHDGKKLAKKEQGEPVAWIDNSGHPKHMSHVQSVLERKLYGAQRPLYEAPQQRTWVGLTDMERHEIMVCNYARTELLAQAIEAKLKEKNT